MPMVRLNFRIKYCIVAWVSSTNLISIISGIKASYVIYLLCYEFIDKYKYLLAKNTFLTFMLVYAHTHTIY